MAPVPPRTRRDDLDEIVTLAGYALGAILALAGLVAIPILVHWAAGLIIGGSGPGF